ncbi:MAG: RNA helicase, partial [Promicromonosporaceae bacterium]|nr:RNA helicase [Promicromonosporaceae bacterium]
CDRGNAPAYFEVRRKLSELEKTSAKANKQVNRDSALRSLEELRRGDVVLVHGNGRTTWHAVVVEAPRPESHRGGKRDAVVVTDAGRQERLTVKNAPGGVSKLDAELRIPKGFSVRAVENRKDLAATLRNTVKRLPHPEPPRPSAGRNPKVTAQIAELRAELKSNAVGSCPEIAEHERWATRYATLERENQKLERRIAGHTDSIAREFERIAAVLQALGYLDTERQITPDGMWLRQIYSEQDLLIAQALRDEVWDDLKPANLSAVVAGVVYEARRSEPAIIPGNPQGPVATALRQVATIWSRLQSLETQNGVKTIPQLDFSLVEPIRAWANGRSLEQVLADTDIAPGDFVRWCKQVIDVLGQVAKAAPNEQLRENARLAKEKLWRGVVALTPAALENGV